MHTKGPRRISHALLTAGLLGAPLTTWPLAWGDIAASLKAPDEAAPLPEHLRSALRRVEARLNKVSDGRLHTRVELAGSSDPELLRSFADAPRSKGEISVSGEGSNDRVAFQIKATAAAAPPRMAATPGSTAPTPACCWVTGRSPHRWSTAGGGRAGMAA